MQKKEAGEQISTIHATELNYSLQRFMVKSFLYQ